MVKLRHIKPVITATALFAAHVEAVAAPDRICKEVDQFHRASFGQNVQPVGRRWVELHWVGFWMDFEKGFGKRCRSSPDAASRRLCEWLIENSSTEFAGRLPQRILTCYGHRFPHAEWRSWRSDVSMLRRDRWLLLEIDLFTMKNQTGAIRLSSFAEDQDEHTVEMPPLAELAEPKAAN
jgi:hypothetical protein